MTATQTQIRRDTAAILDSATPVLAELAYDTTNKRLRLGDGTTQGGTLTPNASDLQRGTFTYAVAGGTANAITLSLTPTLTGYSNGLGVRFRASANNTGSVTVAINGNSANTIQKMTVSGLADLEGGEIMNGGIYDLAYNGTNFVLLNVMQSEASAVEFVGRFTVSGSSSSWALVNIFESGYDYEIQYIGVGIASNTSPSITFSGNGGTSWYTVYSPSPSTSLGNIPMATVSSSSGSAQNRSFTKLLLNDPASTGTARVHSLEYSSSNAGFVDRTLFRFGGSNSTVGADSIRVSTSGANITNGYANIWRKRNI